MTGDYGCRAYSPSGLRCSLPAHQGNRHQHIALTWYTTWIGDAGRPIPRVDGGSPHE